jgi:hypothetical protein
MMRSRNFQSAHRVSVRLFAAAKHRFPPALSLICGMAMVHVSQHAGALLDNYFVVTVETW